MCNDPEIFEQIFQDPFSLFKMVSSGQLVFEASDAMGQAPKTSPNFM